LIHYRNDKTYGLDPAVADGIEAESPGCGGTSLHSGMT